MRASERKQSRLEKGKQPGLFDGLIAQKEFTVRKLLGVGSWFFGCLTAALVIVALAATPDQAFADGGGGDGLQCPGNYDGSGNYLGCQDPGGLCKFGDTNSTCGNSTGGKNCTCLPVAGGGGT